MDFCRFCRARLSEYLDGQLSPSEREKVAAHLPTCADCARVLGQLENEARFSRAAMGELTPAPAPAELRLQVRAALRNDTAHARPLWSIPASSGRWNAAKFAWTGGVTFAAIALVILARPYLPASFSPAPPAFSPSQTNRETASAPAISTAPPRAKPKAAPKSGKKAPPRTVSPPRPNAVAPEVEAAAPSAESVAPSRRRARETALRPAVSSAPPPPAPRRAATAREPDKTLPNPAAAPPRLRGPLSPPRMTGPAPASPRLAAPTPRRNTVPSPPSPSAVAPPSAGARFRAQPAAPSANPRPVETPPAPRFVVALSAVASPAESQRQSLAAKAESAAPRAETAENAGAAPPAAAPLPAPQALRDETENRAPATAGALSRSSPPARALKGVDSVQSTAVPARWFQLSVSATRDVQNAQIRLILPPQVRFSPSAVSDSRTLWRGDLGANLPVVVRFSLHGGRGGEKISLLVEQNGVDGKSQVVETQVLTVPPRNSD